MYLKNGFIHLKFSKIHVFEKIKILNTCISSTSIPGFIKIKGPSLNKWNTIYALYIFKYKGGKTPVKKGQEGMKFHHSLKMLTIKLHSKFQLIWEREMMLYVENPEWTGLSSPFYSTCTYRLKKGVKSWSSKGKVGP
jgi:hypothetical protein